MEAMDRAKALCHEKCIILETTAQRIYRPVLSTDVGLEVYQLYKRSWLPTVLQTLL